MHYSLLALLILLVDQDVQRQQVQRQQYSVQKRADCCDQLVIT